jgi:hypothetical protein
MLRRSELHCPNCTVLLGILYLRSYLLSWYAQDALFEGLRSVLIFFSFFSLVLERS